jgi:glyoxylase-like metal-dependent hydrolase (beta-lactamase superfamily II)
MTPVRVSEHVYYVQGSAGMASENAGFISNAAFVVTGDGVVVFDALGTPSLGAKLLEQIRGVTEEPIREVIVSHYHADHIYGLQVFKDLGARIIAPAAAFSYLESEAAIDRLEERRLSLTPWVDDCTRLVPPDLALTDDYHLELGGVKFDITFLGAAHSEGDLAVFVRPDRVLLSGDIIFEGRIPFVGDADTRHWLQVLEVMETAGVVALIPGHGPAAQDPTAAIGLTRRYLAYLRETFGRAVEELMPFDEAYEGVDWTEFEGLPAFDAANRRNAYQTYLALEAEALEGAAEAEAPEGTAQGPTADTPQTSSPAPAQEPAPGPEAVEAIAPVEPAGPVEPAEPAEDVAPQIDAPRPAATP